jgi:hypothetical protein
MAGGRMPGREIFGRERMHFNFEVAVAKYLTLPRTKRDRF